MTLRFAAALAIVLLPGLAVAEGCDRMKENTAMTCADGHAVDAETGTCVPVVTG